MGWEDRHYNQAGQGGGIGRLKSGSVVMWLIGINCVVFILDNIMAGGRNVGHRALFSEWGNFNVTQAVEGFQVWRLVTYQFLHAHAWHLLGNLLFLYQFGNAVEDRLGRSAHRRLPLPHSLAASPAAPATEEPRSTPS